MKPGRRHGRAAVLLALAASLLVGAANDDAPPARIVKVVAQRFHYTPNEIELKTGQPVVLEFTALDFTHGFNIPDLAIRADLRAGAVTRVRLQPEKAGAYDFLCDNFCGAGHEEMNGRIVVRD